MRVGFVGLGNLGAPMAHMIAHCGWPLAVYARRSQQLTAFSSTKAVVLPSLKQLGDQSDLVCVMVSADKDVHEVIVDSGMLASMHLGSIIAVHSTVHPETCRNLAALAAKTGIAVVDAPVAGGSQLQALVSALGLPLNQPPLAAPGRQLSAGKLAVMVGADRDTFARCRAVFESFGDPIHLMGPVGSGQVTKLVNNLLAYANIATAAAAFELGSELGLELSKLSDVISSGSASSFATRNYAPHFRMGIHPDARRLLRKDIDLAADLIRGNGLESPMLLAAARKILEQAF